MKTLVYLASPHTHEFPEVQRSRYVVACEIAGKLIRQGFHVFSPIAHFVAIADQYQIDGGWEFWREFDIAFLSACRALFVLTIDGWEESVGVQAEIELARKMLHPGDSPESGGGAANAESLVAHSSRRRR